MSLLHRLWALDQVGEETPYGIVICAPLVSVILGSNSATDCFLVVRCHASAHCKMLMNKQAIRDRAVVGAAPEDGDFLGQVGFTTVYAEVAPMSR